MSSKRETVSERELAELIGRAGPREPIPEDHSESIDAAVRAAWRRAHAPRDQALAGRRSGAGIETSDSAEPPSTPRSPWRDPLRPATVQRWLAAAALLLLGAAGAWWFETRPVDRVDGIVLAHAERLFGLAQLEAPAASAAEDLADGGAILLGSTITLDPDPSTFLTLRLRSGHSLRAAAGSRFRLSEEQTIELLAGRIYLESAAEGADAAAGQAAITVQTRFGTVREVGTQFEVALIQSDRGGADGGEPNAVRVRVREGEVVLGLSDPTSSSSVVVSARAGAQLLGVLGSVVQTELRPDDVAWQWVETAAPRFQIEGRSALDLLRWIARERGLELSFAPGAEAMSRVLFKGQGAVGLDSALRVVETAGLEAVETDGVLEVRP